MDRSERAMQYFKEGYNCAQAVVLSFSDILDISEETLLKMSSSFGGGMGRLREVSGTVSGIFMVAGLLSGYVAPDDIEGKTEQYKLIQRIAERFKAENGSIVCRELLGLNGTSTPVPERRTSEYYRKRPCIELVGQAVAIFEKEMNL